MEGSVKEAQVLNIYVYIYIKRNFDTYIHTVYFRRNFHIMELDLFFINRIHPGRTQVVQDELVNHG